MIENASISHVLSTRYEITSIESLIKNSQLACSILRISYKHHSYIVAMAHHLSTLVFFAICLCPRSNIIHFRASKIPGIVSDQALSSIEVDDNGSVWMKCLIYYHSFGLANYSLVTVDENTGKCRLIDPRSYTLTSNTQWDLYSIGKLFST